MAFEVAKEARGKLAEAFELLSFSKLPSGYK